MNRDEQRTRKLSAELRVHRDYAYPVDPEGGGTWFAANRRGFGFALLNLNLPDFVREDRVYLSRGTIIPALVAASSAPEAAQLACEMNALDYPPFRLLIADPTAAPELVVSDGHSLSRSQLPREALMLASSSMRETEVDRYRQDLFRSYLTKHPHPNLSELLAFHATKSTAMPAFGVCMERPEARTVSFSAVSSDVGGARLYYAPQSPDGVRYGIDLQEEKPAWAGH